MNFGLALDHLKAGGKVSRGSWNGKGMWVAYSPGTCALPAEKFWAGANREYAEANGGFANVQPCLTMKNAQGDIQMGWAPTQSDMLSDDWCLVHAHGVQTSQSFPIIQEK